MATACPSVTNSAKPSITRSSGCGCGGSGGRARTARQISSRTSAAPSQMPRGEGGTPRGQVGPASEAEVERLELFRSVKEQPGSILAVAGDDGDVAPQERGSRALEAVEPAAFCQGQEPLRGFERPRLWKLASAAASARPAWRTGSRVRAVARSRNAAAAARPPRPCARPAERSSSAATASSGPAAARARCQARRSAASSGSLTSASASWTRRRSSSDAARYTAERTSGWWNRTRSSISSSPASAAGASAPGRWRVVRPPATAARRPQRLRCRQQHESLRRFGQFGDAPLIPLLERTRKVACRGWRKAPGSLRRAHPLRQFHQRQRIAAGFGDDPVADAVVEPTRHGSRQQGARIGLIEAFEPQLRQAVERPSSGRLAQREDHRHRFRHQAPRDESERLHRGGVEPLRVIHQAQERTLLGGDGEQVEHGDGDQEPVWGIARRDAQGDSGARSAAVLGARRARRASARTADGSRRTAAPSPPGRLRPRLMRRPEACRAAYRSSAVFPMPGSPRITRTAL